MDQRLLSIQSTDEGHSATANRLCRTAVMVALLTPLVSDHTLFFGDVVPKAMLIRTCGLVIAGIVVFQIFRSTSATAGRDLPTLALLGYLGVALLASAAGVSWSHSFFGDLERMGGFLTWMSCGIIYLGVRTYFTAADLRQVSRLLACLCLAVAALSPVATSYGKWVGTFGNTSYLSIYLVIAGGISIIPAVDRSEPRIWRLVGVLAATSALLVVTTQPDRGAQLGLMTAIATGLAVWTAQRIKRLSASAVGWITAATFVLPVAVVSMPWWLPRIPVLNERLGADPNIVARFYFWRSGISAFQTRPLTGFGLESYMAATGRFAPAQLYSLGTGAYIDRAHNAAVDRLVETGAVGTILYLAFFCLVFGAVASAIRLQRVPVTTGSILLGVLAGYFTYLQFWFEDLSSLSVMAVLSGMAVNLRHGGGWIRFDGVRYLDPARRLILGVVGIALVAGSYPIVVRPALAAEAAYRAADPRRTAPERLAAYERAVGLQSPEAAEVIIPYISYLQSFSSDLVQIRSDPGFFRRIENSFEVALSHTEMILASDPYQDLWWLQRGSLLAFGAQLYGDERYLELAMRDLDHSLEMSPQRLATLNFKAQLQWMNEDFSGAEETLAHSLALNDDYGMTHAFQAEVMTRQQRWAEARNELERVYDAGRFPPPRTIQFVAGAMIEEGYFAEAVSILRQFLTVGYPDRESWQRASSDEQWIAETLTRLYTDQGMSDDAEDASARWPAPGFR